MAARVLVFTALIPALLLLGCAPGTGGHITVATSEDSGDPTANGGSGTDKTASEPAPLSGVNLVFSVDQKKIDPTTVSGYIVGAVGSLVIEPYAAAEGLRVSSLVLIRRRKPDFWIYRNSAPFPVWRLLLDNQNMQGLTSMFRVQTWSQRQTTKAILPLAQFLLGSMTSIMT